MDAMAKALVASATHHSGIPELIEDGMTGYLVPETDVSVKANTLQYGITNMDK